MAIELWNAQKCRHWRRYNIESSIESDKVTYIKRGCSPGADGICAEHLIYGATGCVPEVCLLGIIVPVIKKQTLNPNEANNYRPVTLNSKHAKLLEFLVLPEAKIENNQFGFRENRGTSLGFVI